VWRLSPADFPGTSIEGMRRTVHSHAKQHGLSAVTRVDPADEKSLLVQFVRRRG